VKKAAKGMTNGEDIIKLDSGAADDEHHEPKAIPVGAAKGAGKRAAKKQAAKLDVRWGRVHVDSP
jgi:hypothetical protein